MLHFVLQNELACYSRFLLSSYFCILIPYDEKDTSFLVLVLVDAVGFYRNYQFGLFGISGLETDLDYYDVEWFAF